MPAAPDCAAPPACPVCEGLACASFLTIERRRYWRCRECRATFLDPAHWPDPAAERREYDRHRNEPDDPGYRQFLARLADPVLGRLPPRRQGLDYGCGPGPALAAMLAEAGHEMEVWDPLYAPDPAVLEHTYDFITCTEVVEHMHHPATEFRRLNTLLRPGGLLGVMTQFQTDDARFATWHYRRDPTHVVFYREATLRHIASRFRWRCEIPVRDVAIFTRPAT